MTWFRGWVLSFFKVVFCCFLFRDKKQKRGFAGLTIGWSATGIWSRHRRVRPRWNRQRLRRRTCIEQNAQTRQTNINQKTHTHKTFKNQSLINQVQHLKTKKQPEKLQNESQRSLLSKRNLYGHEPWKDSEHVGKRNQWNVWRMEGPKITLRRGSFFEVRTTKTSSSQTRTKELPDVLCQPTDPYFHFFPWNILECPSTCRNRAEEISRKFGVQTLTCCTNSFEKYCILP